MRSAPFAALFIVAGAAVGGCGPDIPDHPTWAADVRPIVVARCVRCHNGGTKGDPSAMSGLYPGDDFDVDQYQPAFVDEGSGFAAVAHGKNASVGRMPPPPMAALEDWQLEILDRWTSDPR